VKQFETSHRLSGIVRALSLAFAVFFVISAQGQGARQTASGSPIRDEDADHIQERSAWFLRGRVVRGMSGAELRRRAYQAKLGIRAARSVRTQPANAGPSLSSGSWTALGPVPLASDATGSGIQDYHQVAGRATSIAIDPADPTGNTVYIGGAQGGVWKSTNAANSVASNVTWTPMTDDQATLATGSIAIQPGNTDPAKSLILVGTGEADNSGDSYFGLGILRSTDAGITWELKSTANNGTLSFSGLGATHMAFSTASGQANIVVAAMAITSEGMIDGAVTSNTSRGLYTSTDAGLTWTYAALLDPGGHATDATSSTTVVYNAAAGLFFAAVRYHGFYSSANGVTWTRLISQPGGTALSATSCPPLSTTNSQACPIYRAEISVVPGRFEMYVWFVSLDSNGNSVDEGIWESTNGGMSWTAINDSGITNCGDSNGCGVQQGFYNLALLAVPNGTTATDLYAGAINIYKCSISSINPACASSSFINLRHVYGCSPLSALAHVHPDQHALEHMIPSAGSDAGNDLMYFANDGGIYRALDGFSLKTGLCSGTNQFDDLNQNLDQ
jgi:large repetitive protein